MKVKLGSKLILGLLLSVVSSPLSPAKAIEVLKLSERVEVTGDIVTLGDIFKGAQKHRGQPLFKSPTLGREGNVPLTHLIDIAERYGFTFETPTDLRSITVSRPGRTIKSEIFKKLLQDELSRYVKSVGNEMIDIKPDTPLQDQMVPLHYSGKLKLVRFQYNPSNKRFFAQFAPEQSGLSEEEAARYQKQLKGYATFAYMRPVLARAIKRGETIMAKDVEMKAFSQYRIPKTALREASEIIGKTATGNLQQGSFLDARDVEATKVIEKNQLVTLVFMKAGLSLKTQGKAMADGGLGDSIAIMNIHSKRIVHGQVKAPGVVVIQNPELVKNKQTAQLQF